MKTVYNKHKTKDCELVLIYIPVCLREFLKFYMNVSTKFPPNKLTTGKQLGAVNTGIASINGTSKSIVLIYSYI